MHLVPIFHFVLILLCFWFRVNQPLVYQVVDWLTQTTAQLIAMRLQVIEYLGIKRLQRIFVLIRPMLFHHLFYTPRKNCNIVYAELTATYSALR